MDEPIHLRAELRHVHSLTVRDVDAESDMTKRVRGRRRRSLTKRKRGRKRKKWEERKRNDGARRKRKRRQDRGR